MAVPTARAEVASPATVVRIVDGDTVEAQLADGREVPVRLIGIDAAEAAQPSVEPTRRPSR